MAVSWYICSLTKEEAEDLRSSFPKNKGSRGRQCGSWPSGGWWASCLYVRLEYEQSRQVESSKAAALWQMCQSRVLTLCLLAFSNPTPASPTSHPTSVDPSFLITKKNPSPFLSDSSLDHTTLPPQRRIVCVLVFHHPPGLSLMFAIELRSARCGKQ